MLGLLDMSDKKIRFKLGCKMLRNAGHLDVFLPEQKNGESIIDWLVRTGLAPDAYIAVDMLLLGKGLSATLNELAGDADVMAALKG
jgi:hypothetical protein